MIRSLEVLSDCDARKRLGQEVTDYTVENVHNFERDGLVWVVGFGRSNLRVPLRTYRPDAPPSSAKPPSEQKKTYGDS